MCSANEFIGIAWLAVEGNPLLFEITGVGKHSVY
jgi:hypothetical protein